MSRLLLGHFRLVSGRGVLGRFNCAASGFFCGFHGIAGGFLGGSSSVASGFNGSGCAFLGGFHRVTGSILGRISGSGGAILGSVSSAHLLGGFSRGFDNRSGCGGFNSRGCDLCCRLFFLTAGRHGECDKGCDEERILHIR